MYAIGMSGTNSWVLKVGLCFKNFSRCFTQVALTLCFVCFAHAVFGDFDLCFGLAYMCT